MAYYSDSINYTIEYAARFDIVRANSSRACVQCYVGNDLVASQEPASGAVRFNIPHLGMYEYVQLLAVDVADADIDYFDDAWPEQVDAGNHIQVTIPTLPGYLRNELWRVYLDAVLDKERLIWPYPDSPTCRIGGRGTQRGYYRGIEAYGSGRGNWRGLQRGYEPVRLVHQTAAQVCGTYAITAATVDAAGNETLSAATNVTVDTYPRPDTTLAVTGYVLGTDTLTFTFTESEDI